MYVTQEETLNNESFSFLVGLVYVIQRLELLTIPGKYNRHLMP